MLDKKRIDAELEAELQEFKKNKKLIEAELRELVWALIHKSGEGN
jgi:hypothetical protein